MAKLRHIEQDVRVYVKTKGRKEPRSSVHPKDSEFLKQAGGEGCCAAR